MGFTFGYCGQRPRRGCPAAWLLRPRLHCSSTYVDPHNQLTGILLTQVGASVPDPVHVMLDFWTTLYQAIDN
ncbi:hypothetical protein ACFXO2_16965 [Streptomyces sp. NPDC059152]|uniref:hypothetical protein n=1 Tax=Streptomyces sp. NPDC059152 TaxID=3346742 RepID=UPI003699C745